jgi:hypothetical protein
LASAIGGVSFEATAQTAPAVATASSGVLPSPFVAGGTNWLSLNMAQRDALAPLEHSWSGLSDAQQRKWIALAINYPKLSSADQEKMHSRMVEWAALLPKDRELARLNFAQTKSIAKSDRAANWEAYQALSPEERKKLAEGTRLKPVGAAVTVKPVAPDKLTSVPVTRHTPRQEREAAASQRALNPKTLLPQTPPVTAPDALQTGEPVKP